MNFHLKEKENKKRKENKQSTFFQQYKNTYIYFVHIRILSRRNTDPRLDCVRFFRVRAQSPLRSPAPRVSFHGPRGESLVRFIADASGVFAFAKRVDGG